MSQVVVPAWKCDREVCGHIWLSKVKPKRCAKCKSPGWDKSTTGLRRRRPRLPQVEARVEVVKEEPVVEAVPAVARNERPQHDPKTCNLYGCLMCKMAKE